MKKTLLFALLAILLSSCAASKEQEGSGRNQKNLRLVVIQILSDNEALALDNLSQLVKLESHTATFYEGQKIKGSFICIGTYHYVPKENVEEIIPVYIKASEYKKLKKKNQIVETQEHQEESTAPED